jgi:hypothetical protein
MRTISEVAGPFVVWGVVLGLSVTDTVTVASPSSFAGGLLRDGSPVNAAA